MYRRMYRQNNQKKMRNVLLTMHILNHNKVLTYVK
jgi:hypothetical protein